MEEFGRFGYLPASQQLLLEGDPAFDLRRRIRVFRTTPHLRAALVAGWGANILFRSPGNRQGRSRPIEGRSFLAGDGNTFYFNALVLELLDMAPPDRASRPEEEAMEAAMVREFEDDFIAYPQGDGIIRAWGYFPRKLHRFESGKPLLRTLIRWGADAADLDSTSMVLSRLLRRGSAAAPPADILTLLEDHVHGEGRFGKEILAYDNGVEAGDRGILLWVNEKHNELDAGVNLNLACLLAVLLGRLEGGERERAFRLSRGVFRFLSDHVERGSYARRGFLMYYSLEALGFLWMRLSHALAALSPEDRARLDPDGATALLGRHLAGILGAEARARPDSFNAFDRLLVLPILLRHGAEAPSGWRSGEGLMSSVEEAAGRAYEFGKFVYPLQLIYGCRALAYCAGLLALAEAGRSGQPAEPAGPATGP